MQYQKIAELDEVNTLLAKCDELEVTEQVPEQITE